MHTQKEYDLGEVVCRDGSKVLMLGVWADGIRRLGVHKQKHVEWFRNRLRTFLALLRPLGAVTAPSYSGGCGLRFERDKAE